MRKFCIIRTEDNYQLVNDYFGKVYNRIYTGKGKYAPPYEHRKDYMCYPKIGSACITPYKPGDYELITTEELKNIIMNKKQKLVGYKLTKPEYKFEAARIGSGDGSLQLFTKSDHELLPNSDGEYILMINQGWNLTVDNLRKSGVLSIWFEPVYEDLPPELPAINGHHGTDKGDTIKYGCAVLNKEWFRSTETSYINTLRLGSGVLIGIAEMEQVREYIKYYDNISKS